MTGQRGPKFALPGTWGRVSLESEASMQRSIRKVVEHAVGRNDNFANLRADMRKGLRESADIARASEAIDFYVSFEIAPGIPMPAWLAVFLPEVAPETFDSLGLEDLVSAIGSVTPGSLTQPAASDRSTSSQIRAVRQVTSRMISGSGDAPSSEIIQVDYWLAASDPNRISLMSFTTQLVELEEQMLDLFDAVISTARWPVPQSKNLTESAAAV